MARFILRRIITALGVLLVSSFLMYILVDLAIDPLQDLYQSTAPNKDFLIQQRIDQLDLDTPAYLRYFKWLGALLTGNLGVAWTTGTAVTSKLSTAIVSTLQLVTAATFLAIILGVFVGIVSALRQYSAFDYLITFVSFVLYSLPSFWVAVFLKEFGAIKYNDFLKDPVLAWGVILVIAAIFGVIVMLAIGGERRKRAISFGIATAATFLMLAYLQLTNWWSKPNIGIVPLVVTSIGIAFIVTILSTGLRNRRSLYTALTTAGVGIVLYYPMQWVFYWLKDITSWPIILGLGAVAALTGALIGVAWRGPDWRQSVRTGVLVAIPVSAMVFLDRVMQSWPEYSKKLSGRPIATIGDVTPNLKGDFWIHTIDTYTHLILPTVSLLLITFAGYTRYARGSMLEVMNQDYIRTARAKGLSERTVVMRHGFRNSLIPLATIVPIDVVTLVGGAIITETIFGRPGMGKLFLDSLSKSEIDPVMAYLVLIGFLAVLANIIADILYALLDPRIRINA